MKKKQQNKVASFTGPGLTRPVLKKLGLMSIALVIPEFYVNATFLVIRLVNVKNK